MESKCPFYKVGDMIAVSDGDTAIINCVRMIQPNVLRIEAWCEAQRRHWKADFEIVIQEANDASSDHH